MTNIDPSWVLCELRETLGRLAQDPAAQEEYADSLGTGIDELALEFDAVAPVAPALAARKLISRDQAVAISAVHDKLGQMSGSHNSALWTSEALHVAPEWTEVRRLASLALDLLSDLN